MKPQILPFLAGALSIRGAACLNLNVTAIGAQHGSSTLECWQMDEPFKISTEPGTAGSAAATLSNVANMSYSILPSSFDAGVHNAPHNQQVAPLWVPDLNTELLMHCGWLDGLSSPRAWL